MAVEAAREPKKIERAGWSNEAFEEETLPADLEGGHDPNEMTLKKVSQLCQWVTEASNSTML